MPDYTQVKKELVNYIYARTPLVIVNTSERERIERMLHEIAEETQIIFQYYTDAKQVKLIGARAENADTNDDPLGYFLNLLKRQRSLTIVLGDVRRVSDDNTYSRELMNILYIAKENNGVVILITPDAVWSRLSGFGMVTALDLPDTKERIAQIQRFMKMYGGRFPVEWTQTDIPRAAAVLRGFSEMQIENILSAEITGSRGLMRDRLCQIADQKQKLYPPTGTVQHIQPGKTYDVSGMGNLKRWLEEKKKIFFLPETVLEEYDLTAPKGILLVGVPGCGKSLTAKLVAQQWELPLFRFDIGSVFDKWVGESEKKIREALRYIENVSPCILWIDEIEKVLATTEAGNETGKRVLGEFLFWIQESSSKVFMVATANHVQALPYELYRKGRFSEVFYAGLPDEEERRSALIQYMKISLKIEPEDSFLEELVQITAGYSYSDIETAVKEVAQKVLLGTGSADCRKELVHAVESMIPISRINPELVREMEEWGRERAVNVSEPVGR